MSAHTPGNLAGYSAFLFLQGFIDNVSVAHNLTISGRKTTMQGTLGPYFQHEGKLYAITCRHNLLLPNDGNIEFNFNTSAPEREVVVMRKPAFDSYVDSVEEHIRTLNETVKTLNTRIQTLTDRVQQGINLAASQHRLEQNQAELDKIERRIVALKHFYVTLSTKWDKLSDRIIGHIVWAPPIDTNTRSEISRGAFIELMDGRMDVPHDFEYPFDDLLPLRGMLTADKINNPNSLDSQGDRVHRVIKRGSTTLTTVGTLSRFMSFVCNYEIAGRLESLELAILPHESVTARTFAKGGDSGAIVVSPRGEYVGQLTGATSQGMDGSDIAYATLFQYIWEVVLAKFPGANLYWDDIPAFLAAMPA